MKTEDKPVKATERRTVLGSPLISVLLAAGIGTAAFGLLALLGWVLGWPLLTSFGADLIPMAPSTAVLFLLNGVAVSLRARTPLSGRAYKFSVMAGFLGILVSLGVFMLGYLDIQWSGEHIGLNITGTFQGSPRGHMSPVTALVFLFAGLSFLAWYVFAPQCVATLGVVKRETNGWTWPLWRWALRSYFWEPASSSCWPTSMAHRFSTVARSSRRR